MSDIQRYDYDKAWGMEKHELGDYVQYDDHAAIVAQLEADLAQSQKALKLARDWARGDKWRTDPEHSDDWKWYVAELDAVIKEQGK